MAKHFPGRLTVVGGRYGDMARRCAAAGHSAVDGRGAGSRRLLPADRRRQRGFSFREDGPSTCAWRRRAPARRDAVNSLPEKTLADIIYAYGEERRRAPRRRAIVEARGPRTHRAHRATGGIVRRGGAEIGADGIDRRPAPSRPCASTLTRSGRDSPRGSPPRRAQGRRPPGGGILPSLEDRLVKNFLRLAQRGSPACLAPLPDAPPMRRGRHVPALVGGARRPPGQAEIAANPRARSAACVPPNAPRRRLGGLHDTADHMFAIPGRAGLSLMLFFRQSTRVKQLEGELTTIERCIVNEERAIHVLRAGMAHLNECPGGGQWREALGWGDHGPTIEQFRRLGRRRRPRRPTSSRWPRVPPRARRNSGDNR
jgi:16S rRNA (cytosine1402-N4)-methyltransferase